VTRLLLIALISAVAGAMNSIAGGGTLLTFPALIGLGIPPLNANATSTVALWPASLASVAGYREVIGSVRRWAIWLAVPSVLGGCCGALLLLATPERRFNAIVPWLVLGATGLFVVQRPVMSALARRRQRLGVTARSEEERIAGAPPAAALVAQFVISIYGGYFGAGMGILMLAVFGIMGLTHIHRMNGLKNWIGFACNATAAALFALSDLIRWPVAFAMTAGAMVGGYAGSRLAQRVSQRAVRGSVVAIGVGTGFWMLFR
jgi:uncharacterized membrane protein YfcA